jgi:peptidoglycan/LPS O-acetylase OafA/YrhL
MLIGTAVATSKDVMTPAIVFCLSLIALGDSKRINKDWIGSDWNLASIVISFLVFVLVYKISILKPRLFAQRFFVYLGELVYPLYLFHIPVGIGSILILRKYTFNNLEKLLLSLVFIVAFSHVIHVLIEKNGIRLGKQVQNRLDNLLKRKSIDFVVHKPRPKL